MARKRFSDLERIYDALKLGNVETSSLPQNLDFVKYAKWREGNGPERNIIRPNLNGEVSVGVKAFGFNETDDQAKQLVTMSGRSSAFLNGFAPKAKFGVITTGLNDFFKDSSFVPAKARIATIVTGTTQTSAITGRKYKDKTGAAYTVPMGQTAGTIRYQEHINDILTDDVFSGSNRTHTVSFDPEEFRRD
ncbi:hypothetical protein H6F92_04740 [Microcystis wesenbergii FACHB-1317]|jgi:hypothetical protein|uniref:hypothetical protein n=1 Tax=Microcystis TaxID=1125 RepID=UPI000E3B0E6F|nr:MULTISPECIES: hypothetical protein [Microcystis]MBD2288160.1 hypothetical protein [Microcystis wesenbergii FACHB-1317]REJ40872.1 MAG: hypothetical protein DWQ58_25065 [Microcystis aeruginosa TA09]UZO77895.1 hypothetical protein M8120_08375 [Microcystis aeruginosa str. Chao 1910]